MDLTEQIGDPIPRDAEEPRTHPLDRLHQPIGFDQLVEDLLQNVFGVLLVGHAPADEAFEFGAVELNQVGDPLVLLASHIIHE